MHTFCEDMDATEIGYAVIMIIQTREDMLMIHLLQKIYFGVVSSNTNNNTCNDLLYGFSNDQIDMDENYMSYAYNTWMFSQAS